MTDNCDRWREAISARADSEDPSIELSLIDAHLALCPACTTYAADIASTRSAFRIAAAPTMPDLSDAVVKRLAAQDRRSWSVARGLLAVVALQILAFALPVLLLGDEEGTPSHGARHLGAFTVAYAIGILYVAFRPARARAMLPTAAVLMAALVISGIVGVIDGATTFVNELSHLPELLSAPLLWLVARPTPSNPAPSRRPVLRLTHSDTGAHRKTG